MTPLAAPRTDGCPLLGSPSGLASPAGIRPPRHLRYWHYIHPALTAGGPKNGVRPHPADYAIKVCFADVGDLAVEIMQPLFGPSIFQEYLNSHGEGIHHVAFDVEQRPWEERLAAFASRGFSVSQSGRFMDQNAFAFFDTERASGTTFETYDIPAGFIWPEPEAWFPGPPPAGQAPPVRLQETQHCGAPPTEPIDS